jgi:regulator of sigma E protease
MITAIIFILILGVLIFVHELGHFLTARRNGIRAEEFGFGFPPRIFGYAKTKKDGKFKIFWGNKEVETEDTVYSLNWIPLGGFVKIKGENGTEENDFDSFAAKSAWIRIKVLGAGVMMNFVLAWFLISIVFMLGAPAELVQMTDSTLPIKISEVSTGSPAESVGLLAGDEIVKKQTKVEFRGVADFVAYANAHKGESIDLAVVRNNKTLNFSVIPRIDVPAGEGPLGVSFGSEVLRFSFFEAIYKGMLTVLAIILAMLVALGGIIKGIFVGQKMAVEVAGPVGIALMTKQAVSFGLSSVALFVSILSINLGVINALPIPALDGGRILFILIEKLKGSPVSQKTEQHFHMIGFLILIGLMIFVTFKDVINLIK